MKLCEKHTWVDESGNEIHELRPAGPFAGIVEHNLGGSEPTFFAIASHTLNVNGRAVPDQFKIDIAASSIEEAFEMLPDLLAPAAKRRILELTEQAETHRRRNEKQLLLPNGQKLPPMGSPKTRFA